MGQKLVLSLFAEFVGKGDVAFQGPTGEPGQRGQPGTPGDMVIMTYDVQNHKFNLRNDS